MTVLTIIRGIPGSGKTTFAERLGVPFCEADQHMVDDAGNYAFDRARLSLCHARCRDEIEAFLMEGKSCAVSNTNLTIREIVPYLALADKYKVQTVQILTMRGDYGSTHAVPDDVMARYRETLASVTDNDLIKAAEAFGYGLLPSLHDVLYFTRRPTLALKGWK